MKGLVWRFIYTYCYDNSHCRTDTVVSSIIVEYKFSWNLLSYTSQVHWSAISYNVLRRQDHWSRICVSLKLLFSPNHKKSIPVYHARHFFKNIFTFTFVLEFLWISGIIDGTSKTFFKILKHVICFGHFTNATLIETHSLQIHCYSFRRNIHTEPSILLYDGTR